MAKKNQQGREDVYASTLSAVKALDLYAQFHTDCIKPENGDTKVLAKEKKKKNKTLSPLAGRDKNTSVFSGIFQASEIAKKVKHGRG